MITDRELMKGASATLVLALLCDAPTHGYALARRIKTETDGLLHLGEGTLYPLLYNLESKGWITATWQIGPTKRRRRVYRLTNSGKKKLHVRAAQWRQLSTAMNSVLGDR
jgi:PadR family transcriptional regulator